MAKPLGTIEVRGRRTGSRRLPQVYAEMVESLTTIVVASRHPATASKRPAWGPRVARQRARAETAVVATGRAQEASASTSGTPMRSSCCKRAAVTALASPIMAASAG